MMTTQISQTKSVMLEINKLIDEGMKDRTEIYTKVVENLKVPRPTVRRIASELRTELQAKVDILSAIECEK